MAGMPDTGTIAIDVGGTFTDITFADAGTGATWVAKTPSTPGDRGGRDDGGPRGDVACLALFVLPSSAMASDISPPVRSDRAPTGTLRVGLNHGNFLPAAP